MRIGLYGGSFDPVHRGHLRPVLEAKETARLDRVIYLPTAVPPHKPDRHFAPAEHRFAMVEKALADYDGFELSRHEMGAAGPSYTVETLEHFAARNPGAELRLILGADSFLQLDRWVRFRDILRSAVPVVLRRPGWEPRREELSPEIRALLDDPRVIWVENTPIAASSTEIRRRLSAGEPVPEGWLPPSVLKYIREYDLYAGRTDPKS